PHPVHRTAHIVGIMHLSPAFAEMETRPSNSNRVEPFQFIVAQRVAHDAYRAEILPLSRLQRCKLVDEQPIIGGVTRGVHYDAAPESQLVQHTAHVGEGRSRWLKRRVIAQGIPGSSSEDVELAVGALWRRQRHRRTRFPHPFWSTAIGSHFGWL